MTSEKEREMGWGGGLEEKAGGGVVGGGARGRGLAWWRERGVGLGYSFRSRARSRVHFSEM
jgi:hypothetical protein